jgi:hypothetical protein
LLKYQRRPFSPLRDIVQDLGYNFQSGVKNRKNGTLSNSLSFSVGRLGTVYTRQKPDYFPRFFLGWFPSCVNFQKVEFGHEQELFPDDGSCDENFEMILTGMESHGTRYDQNIRNKFENDLLIAKCG